MIQSTSGGKAEDIRSVCKIVHSLLHLQDATGVRGIMGMLAWDFTGVSPMVTPEDLLQVRPTKYDRYLSN